MDLKSVWRNMHARCYLPRASGYETTGGRGIIVERRWHDYEVFAKDVGVPPHRKYRFARKDLNGHFGPGNCAWMPPGTPQLRQNTRRFTDGVFEGTLGECAQRLQISKELARWRFKTWGTFEKGEQWRQLLKPGLRRTSARC